MEEFRIKEYDFRKERNLSADIFFTLAFLSVTAVSMRFVVIFDILFKMISDAPTMIFLPLSLP